MVVDRLNDLLDDWLYNLVDLGFHLRLSSRLRFCFRSYRGISFCFFIGDGWLILQRIEYGIVRSLGLK